jgi:hypothetical protein
MPNKLPPAPVGVPPGHSFWNDWYERLRSLINPILEGISWDSITDKPDNMADLGINEIDITGDVIIDTDARGLVLKDAAGPPHYWRITINSAGTLVITDLGTTKP